MATIKELIETRKFKHFEIHNRSMIPDARFAHIVLYAQMLEQVIDEYEIAFKLIEEDVKATNQNYLNNVICMVKDKVAHLIYNFPPRKTFD